MEPADRQASAALAAQTLLSAGTFLFVKDALGSPDAPGPWTWPAFLTARFAVAAVVLVALVLREPRAYAFPRAARPRLLALGIVGVPLNVGFFFAGASLAPAGHAALLYSMTPVFVFAIERARGRERADRARVVGLLLAVAGALVVILGRGDLSGPEPRGDLLLACAALCWACYTVLAAPLARERPRETTVVSLLVGSAFLVLAAPFTLRGIDAPAFEPRPLAAVLYTAIFTTIVAYRLWLFALSRLRPTAVAIFTNLQPPTTALLAALFLGERLDARFAIGTALVLAGVFLVQRASPS